MSPTRSRGDCGFSPVCDRGRHCGEKLKGGKSTSVTVGLFTLLGNAGSRGEPASVQRCSALRFIVLHCGAAVGAVGTVECSLHCTVHSAHSSVTVDPRWRPAGSDLAPHRTSCKLLPGVAWDFTQYCLVLPGIADSIDTVLTH